MEFGPESVGSMSNDEINRHAKREWEKCYERVETLLKRFHPIAWTQLVAHQFRAGQANFDVFRSRPPHFLLRSIEANAAYWRKQNDDKITEQKFLRVMHAYMSHNDPLFLSFVSKSLVSMFLVMNREQIELQVDSSDQELARPFLLFVVENPVPKLTAAFTHRYGITPLQWIQLCYVTFLSSSADHNSRVTSQHVADFAKGVLGANAIDWFVKKISWTPEQFAENYRAVRKQIALQFHSFIRSAFLQTPIIDCGGGRWIAPDPLLVFKQIGVGLYRMFQELWNSSPINKDELRHEFAETIEDHVERILDCYNGKLSLWGETELIKLSTAKSCDFLLDTPDAIVLVESKGVAFDRNLLLPQYMQEDITTTRIIDAAHQLKETYDDYLARRFDSLGLDRNKPVVSIIATYGEVPYANSEWYFTNVIAPRARALGKPFVSSEMGLPSRPYLMSHQTLEMFVTGLNTLNLTPLEFVGERKGEEFSSIGEWNAYLRRRLHGMEIQRLPFIQPAARAFHKSLSIDDASLDELYK